MNRRDVVELFGVIKAIYQNQFNGDDLAVSVWHKLLAELPKELVLGALHDFVNDGGDFPPNCSQLLKRANRRKGPAISPRLTAAECWREILNSGGRTPDRLSAEALQIMGGWRKIGSMPEKQVEQWGKRDFIELYLELHEIAHAARVNDASANTALSGKPSQRRLLT